jgi:hypothetical protein
MYWLPPAEHTFVHFSKIRGNTTKPWCIPVVNTVIKKLLVGNYNIFSQTVPCVKIRLSTLLSEGIGFHTETDYTPNIFLKLHIRF